MTFEINFFNEDNILSTIEDNKKDELINSYFNNELQGFILNSNSNEFLELQISIKELKALNFITFNELVNNYFLRNRKGFKSYKNAYILVIIKKNGDTDNMSIIILSNNLLALSNFKKALKRNNKAYEKRKALLNKSERSLLYILKNINNFHFKYSYNFNFLEELQEKEEEELKYFKERQKFFNILNKEIKELKATFKECEQQYIRYLTVKKTNRFIERKKERLIKQGYRIQEQLKLLEAKRKKARVNYLIALNMIKNLKNTSDKFIYSLKEDNTTLEDYNYFKYSKKFLEAYDNKLSYYQAIKKYKDF